MQYNAPELAKHACSVLTEQACFAVETGMIRELSPWLTVVFFSLASQPVSAIPAMLLTPTTKPMCKPLAQAVANSEAWCQLHTLAVTLTIGGLESVPKRPVHVYATTVCESWQGLATRSQRQETAS